MAIKFDLDDVEIPSGATVTKAEMSLYAYNRYASLNNGAKRLYKITSSWSEGSIKYNNMPSVSSSSIASSNNSSINVWENFDVTDEIKGVIEDGDANNGFLIRFSSYSRGVSMRSSEYSTMDYRPKLVITIEDDNAPSVTVTNPLGGEQYKAGTDEFITWDAEDTRGIACRAIYLSTDNGSNYELVDSAEGNTGSYEWTIPDEVSDECLIKVFVYDEAGNSGTDISAVFAIIPAVGIITDYKFNLPIAKEYNVTILNTQGRELTSFKIQNLDQLNNIQASLSAGMHLIKISALNQTAVRKLFIAR